MILMGDRVPMYKMRPHRGLLWTALLVVVIGGLLSAYFFNEDYAVGSSRGLFTLIVTGILALFFVIAATSHFWFRHLWHRRAGYKRG